MNTMNTIGTRISRVAMITLYILIAVILLFAIGNELGNCIIQVEQCDLITMLTLIIFLIAATSTTAVYYLVTN